MGQAHRPGAERVRIAAAFYAIVFIGLFSGAGGVLLPAQITGYGIDKATIGLIFLTFSTGYVVSAVSTGPLIHRLGPRAHLILGSALAVATMGAVGFRPSFVLLLVLQLGLGFGFGALDAGLNAFLSGQPGSTALLNYFHGFFGVGALLGPVLAAAMIARGLSWQAIYAILAAAGVLMVAAFTRYPGAAPPDSPGTGDSGRATLAASIRLSAVWLAAAFLGIYVGLEAGVGNWGFAFLTETRGADVLVAGWIVSGYWLGLTVGRFVLNALAQRLGVGVAVLTAGCIGGVAVSAAVAWLVPAATTAGLVALGFFLGPLFPTMIATLPRLVPARLVASAIGVLAAVSIAGGALFPWLIGAAMQGVGPWVLLPLTLALCVPLGWVWWALARRLRAAPAPAATTTPAPDPVDPLPASA